jgi:hypothetical protein
LPEYESVIPAGLTCDDFATEELGWHVALGYWFVNSRPQRMDPDRDGLPCEDVSFPIIHEDGTKGTIIWEDHLGIDSHRPGMLCRELVVEADHPPYWVALLYWLSEGEPARMDADRDGIPCETVYPEAFIRDFLEDPDFIEEPWGMTTDALASGMYCRDLIWWRPFYVQALGYFYAEGFPSRMDADNDGVPCETVYSDTGLWETSRADTTCEVLADEWSWYPAVAFHWLQQGRPADLDPDGDGYPCSPGWPWPEEVEYFKDGSPWCCAG